MNLKEQLTAKAELIGDLKLELEDGNEEVAEQLASAIEDAKGLQSRIAEADEAEQLLKSLGGIEKEGSMTVTETPAKSLGEFAAKTIDFTAMRSGAAKSAGTSFGFKAATDAHTAPTIETLDQNVVDSIPRDLVFRSLFGSESISGNSLKYFELGVTEGAPTAVAENAQKPQFHIPYTPKTVSLQKIAGWYYETDELIEDAAFLKSSIDNRGLFELDKANESYLATTLLATSGIQTLAPAGSALAADDVFKAMMNVKSTTNYDADAIVINPTDYQALRLAKDSNLQYYGGGYFYAPYGNGSAQQQPNLWGINTVVTTAVPAGTVLVGAFRPGASVITKSGDGVRVEVVTGDHDDRTNNRVTVIVEERLALATRIPAAFVKIA